MGDSIDRADVPADQGESAIVPDLGSEIRREHAVITEYLRYAFELGTMPKGSECPARDALLGHLETKYGGAQVVRDALRVAPANEVAVNEIPDEGVVSLPTSDQAPALDTDTPNNVLSETETEDSTTPALQNLMDDLATPPATVDATDISKIDFNRVVRSKFMIGTLGRLAKDYLPNNPFSSKVENRNRIREEISATRFPANVDYRQAFDLNDIVQLQTELKARLEAFNADPTLKPEDLARFGNMWSQDLMTLADLSTRVGDYDFAQQLIEEINRREVEIQGAIDSDDGAKYAELALKKESYDPEQGPIIRSVANSLASVIEGLNYNRDVEPTKQVALREEARKLRNRLLRPNGYRGIDINNPDDRLIVLRNVDLIS